MNACSVSDAGDVVRLFHIIDPSSKSATEASTHDITDDKQLVSVSVHFSSVSLYFIQLLHCADVIVRILHVMTVVKLFTLTRALSQSSIRHDWSKCTNTL